MRVNNRRLGALVDLAVFVILISLVATPSLVAGPTHEGQHELTTHQDLNSNEDLIGLDNEDVSKEILIMDLLSATVGQLEKDLLNIKDCLNSKIKPDCNSLSDYCLTTSEDILAIQKTVDMIQAHLAPPPQRPSRGLSSVIHFKFSSDDFKKYQNLKTKYKSLIQDKNNLCR